MNNEMKHYLVNFNNYYVPNMVSIEEKNIYLSFSSFPAEESKLLSFLRSSVCRLYTEYVDSELSISGYHGTYNIIGYDKDYIIHVVFKELDGLFSL